MGVFGNLLGSIAGNLGSKFLPIPGVNGGELGGAIGTLLPFKTGGAVKKTGPAYLHKGEFVLSPGLKPTAHQRKVVAKNKAKAKKNKKC
jgi:hypothetical protein